MRPGGTLNLSQVTLTGGNISGTSGGAIRVGTAGQAMATLNLSDAALVGNSASAQGGAIFSQNGNTTIERSVITANSAGSAANGGGGVYAGNPGSFAMGSTIVAGNTANGAANNMEIHVSTVNNQSLGNNILGTDPATTGDDWAVFGATGDMVESAADYIVTSLVDTNRSTFDAATLSVREAVMKANLTAGAETILLPAWQFGLTIARRDPGAFPTDILAAYGDLDVTESLTVRGIAGATSVAWRGDVVDAIFDLIGDFDGNGVTTPDDGFVTGNDYLIWQTQLGMTGSNLSADADDDGDVDADDRDLWAAHFGNSLALLNVA